MRRPIRARAPPASSQGVRRIMRRVGRENTACEIRVRSAVHRVGLRFRVNWRPDPELKCKADLIFPTQRVCVFVDGCFWHGCRKHFRPPTTNRSWWIEKIRDVQARDRRQAAVLRHAGCTVIRCWEHEVFGDLSTVVEDIAVAVGRRQKRVAMTLHLGLAAHCR